MGCGRGAKAERLQLPPGAHRPGSALPGDGFPSSPGVAGLWAWEERERDGGAALAAGPRVSAGDRPRPILGASLPAAEPPRPGDEIWALGAHLFSIPDLIRCQMLGE